MHRLLNRQLKRTLADRDNLSDDIRRLLHEVDEAYRGFDSDREMLERSLELSSNELITAAAEIRASEELLRRTLESTDEGILAVAAGGTILHVNDRYFEILELSRQDFESLDPQVRVAAIAERMIDPEVFTKRALQVFDAGEAETFDLLQFKSGRVVERSSRPLTELAGISGRVMSYRDVTERYALEEQLRHQAFHDPLTDLANRARFHDRLDHAIERSLRTKAPVFVLFIDIDNFKSVNDTLGHTVGDRLIVTIAERIAQSLSGGDTAARLGGDEFGIILEDLMSLGDALGTAEYLLAQIRSPVQIEQSEFVVDASIGVAAGDSESTSEKLIRNADIAMYAAKNRGKGRVQVYESGMHTQLSERQSLLADLGRAVEREELAVYFQPIVHLESGEISGAEALVRWNHPTRGMILPDRFIPLAEETGVILEIGAFVLRDACRLIKEWEQRFTGRGLLISVNVSAKQIRDRDFVHTVRKVIEETGINPNDLVLELTESAVLEDPQRAQQTLKALKQLGVKLALDDFGTRYSSLTYLKQFPIDVLKIDKSFINDLHLSEKEMALAGATIALGQKLRLRIVAEGIERADQLKHLQGLNCDFGQGYLFSRPLTREDLDHFMDENVQSGKTAAA